jgi:hypothetical protein
MSERSKRTMDTAAPLPHGDRPDPATEAFLAHRNLLFTVAYEMLGSAADAEDVLQETWLRWAGVDLGTVRDQRAYLVRIATRQALARLRTLGRRRESYAGPWLPEPLLTNPGHRIAAAQMTGFGAVLAFEVADALTADRLCNTVQVIVCATSPGGVESTIERRSKLPGQGHVPPVLLRLSVGCEHIDDLWNDMNSPLEQASRSENPT